MLFRYRGGTNHRVTCVQFAPQQVAAVPLDLVAQGRNAEADGTAVNTLGS